VFIRLLYERLTPRDMNTCPMSHLFDPSVVSPTGTVLKDPRWKDPRWNPYSAEQPERPVYIYLVARICIEPHIPPEHNVFICPSSDMQDICRRLKKGKYDAVQFTALDFPTLTHFSAVAIIAQVIVALSDTLEHVDMSFLHDTADIDDPTELVQALVKAPHVKTFDMTWTICEHQLGLNEVLNRLAQKRGIQLGLNEVLNRLAQKRGIQLGLEYEQSGGCTCPGKCVVSERFKDI
jgi:hypothetical protein